MTSINDAVTTAMNNNGLRQYTRQAAPVVAALEAREKEITSTLLQAAVNNGINRDEAVRVFTGAGLAMPDAGGEAGDANTLAALVEFARRHGFRG